MHLNELPIHLNALSMHLKRFQTVRKKKKKRDKIRVDEGSEFYDSSFKKWSDDNDIKIYSTYNEGKSVFPETFIRTLKNKIYKHMTTVSKNVYFHVLNDIVDKYNNTYHKTIKMKPIDVKSDSMLDTMLILMIKILNLRQVIMLEFQNIETFLLKNVLLIGQKKFLL